MLMLLTMTEAGGSISAERPDAQILDQCINAIAQGDQDAFAQFYQLTRTAAYSYALSILKHPHDAEDVLHDCYLSVYANASGYRSSGKPMAWLITIVRNLSLMKLRARGRTADLPPEELGLDRPVYPDLPPEDRVMLQSCLNDLSDEARQIVVLHAVAGFRHREIAQLLQLPLSTVLSKYNRALKTLKTKLEEGDLR